MLDKLSKMKKHLPAMPDSRGILFGFLLSFILLVLIFSHLMPANEALTLWDRTIGPATLAGIDIQKRTGHFSSLIIFWIPFVAIVISLVYSKFSVKFHLFEKGRLRFRFKCPSLPAQAFTFFFSVIFSALFLIVPLPALSLTALPLAAHACFFAIILFVAIFATRKTNIFSSAISPLFLESTVIFPILLFVATAAYTSKYLIPLLATKSDLYSQIQVSSIQEQSLACIMLSLGSFLLISILDIHKKWPLNKPVEYLCIFLTTNISISSFTGIPFGYATLATFAFFTIAALYFIRRSVQSQIALFRNISKGLVWIPAIVTVSLEIVFVLTEKGFSVPFPWGIILSICVIFLLLQKKFPASIYAGALISLSAVAFLGHTYQQIWDFKDYAYLYEMGNKTVALGTMLHGELPIIDYFSAHALFDIWTQILHAFVSPGITGILLDPYGGLNEIIALLILYFILKKFISPAAALLFVAFFPFNVLGIKAYNICFIAILAHYLLQAKPSIRNFILFWGIIAANAFFLYDDGVSLGIAAIVATCLMLICKRDKACLLKFIFTGCAVGVFLAATASILCITKGIAPADRFKEWLDLTLKSSAIWATVSIGNPHSPAYIFAYFIAPATASFALYYTAYKSFRNKNLSFIAGATIIFALAELLFIPRGIIFHNLTENNGIAGRLLNFWPWTISCFTLFLLEERNRLQAAKNWCWALTFGVSLFISAGLVTRYLPNANSQLASTSIVAAAQFEHDFPQNIQGPRITYSERTTNFIGTFRASLDSVLNDSETFLDFSNSTALYAMVGRKSPSYVAQTPGLLSTVYSQKRFIEQAKSESAPIAVIGNADLPYLREMTWEPHNIPHNIRYYLIAEYIYENYQPYKVIGDYALWCKKGRCTESLPYDYDASARSAHHYSLNMLPYIWANNDALQAIANPEISDSRSDYSKKPCYLELAIENRTGKNVPAKVTLNDPETNHAVTFDFTAVPESKQYLIRVSADSYWHGYNLSEVKLTGDGITLHKFKFLGGD